jgi:hypothetical protein
MATKKKLDFIIQSIVGNIVFSDKEVWGFWSVPLTVYDFLSMPDKARALSSMTSPFISLMRGKETPLDLMMLMTNAPLDIDKWEQGYRLITETLDRRKGFNDMMKRQVELLKTNDFVEKRVFIGIKLNNRHALNVDKANPLEVGFKEAGMYLKSWFDNFLKVEDKEPTETEIRQAKSIEDEYDMIISSGSLEGVRTSTEELAMIIKKVFYPAMPVPAITFSNSDRWGHGDMLQDLNFILDTSNPKWVKINQTIDGEDVTGYRATLTFKSFPESMNPPVSMPWIYNSINAGIMSPFDVYARFTLESPKKVRKEIEKNRKIREDGAQNAMGANARPSAELVNDLQEAQDLEEYVASNDQPWVRGTFRMAIESQDPEQLKSDANVMIQQYSKSDIGNDEIKLVWTYHDQVELLLESLPGDKLRENSFEQMATVPLVSASGFNIFNEVGD